MHVSVRFIPISILCAKPWEPDLPVQVFSFELSSTYNFFEPSKVRMRSRLFCEMFCPSKVCLCVSMLCARFVSCGCEIRYEDEDTFSLKFDPMMFFFCLPAVRRFCVRLMLLRLWESWPAIFCTRCTLCVHFRLDRIYSRMLLDDFVPFLAEVFDSRLPIEVCELQLVGRVIRHSELRLRMSMRIVSVHRFNLFSQ